MTESGIDLSYDEMDQLQALSGQPTQRLVVIAQPASATTSSPASSSSGAIMAGGVKPRFQRPTVQLRTGQKLLLMKQKAEDEENRRRRAAMSATVTVNNGQTSIPLSQSTPRLSSSVVESTAMTPSIINIKSQVMGKYQSADPGQSNAVSDERSMAHTAPSHYYMMDGSSPRGLHASYSAPQNSAFRVTSPLSIDDDITSTATSLSEVDEVLLLDQYDQSDVVINELSEMLPHSLIETANYLDSSQIEDEKPVILPASFPSATNSRPYRGGRRRESPPPLMNREQQQEWDKQRQKKDNHNDIEKRRRLKINENILVLGTMLPAEYDLDIQNNRKGAILEASVKYLKRLQKTQEEKEKLAERERALLQQNRKLALENQKLLMTLQQMQTAITNACQPQPQQTVVQQPTVAAVQDNLHANIFEQHMNIGTVYPDNSVIPANFGDVTHEVTFVASNSSPDLPIQVLHVNDEIDRVGEDLMDLEPSISSIDCLYEDAMLPGANDVAFGLSHVDQSMSNQYSSYHTLSDDLFFH